MNFNFIINKLLNRNLYYEGNLIHSPREGNRKIYKLLVDNDKPFMVSRIGSVELSALLYYVENIHDGKIKWPQLYKDRLSQNAGFFPVDDNMITKFCSFYIEHLKQIDVLGVWFNEGEDLIINKFATTTYLTFLRSLEPYYFKIPWSKALKGNKVLLIHPFSETISKQFRVKEKLFRNKNVLPDFTLETLKAVQSIGTTRKKFPDWFASYDHMCNEILKKDFDIAIIGAGAYGLPLASYVKSVGKKSIHLGGATQILFGIRGRRWDTHPSISKLYNDFWVRPATNETPADTQLPEEGCYW